MLRRIKRTIDEHRLFRGGGPVLVGVSGGADSVAMLYALHYLQKDYKLTLTVAHLNHCIRGDAAGADERFVRQLAWRLKIPVVCDARDVPQMASAKGISLEMAAREARYEFFKRAAEMTGARMLAVAHTSDDQAETVLLRLTRGSSLQGLAGIPYRNELYGLSIIRPMRDVEHDEAVTFLTAHGLDWREDASNRDPRFLRNRVRHSVIPMLERELNPRIKRTLVRTGDLLRQENDWLDQMADRILRSCRYRMNASALRADILSEHPVAAQRRVLLHWLAENGVDIALLDSSSLFRLEHLCANLDGTRSIPLPGGWVVQRKYEKLALRESPETATEPYRLPLAIPGETIIPEHDIRVVTQWRKGLVRQAEGKVGQMPAEVTLDASSVKDGELYVRSWQNGDRLRPLGMRGSKKIQDLFVDHKVPRAQRSRVPLLECGKEVVWVPGYQIARGWEVKHKDAQSLHVYMDHISG